MIIIVDPLVYILQVPNTFRICRDIHVKNYIERILRREKNKEKVFNDAFLYVYPLVNKSDLLQGPSKDNTNKTKTNYMFLRIDYP